MTKITSYQHMLWFLWCRQIDFFPTLTSKPPLVNKLHQKDHALFLFYFSCCSDGSWKIMLVFLKSGSITGQIQSHIAQKSSTAWCDKLYAQIIVHHTSHYCSLCNKHHALCVNKALSQHHITALRLQPVVLISGWLTAWSQMFPSVCRSDLYNFGTTAVM